MHNRIDPRYAVDVAIDIRPEDGSSVAGRTKNVSRGGICAVFPIAIPAATKIEVGLSLVFDEHQLSEPLVLPARVVWCTAIGTSHQLGATFLALTAEQRGYLDIFLRYLERGAADVLTG